MKRETILVTGAAGLIGANIVAELNSLGYDRELILVDHLGKSPHKWKNLSCLKFRDYVEGDDFYSRGFGGHGDVTTVFHMGARSHTTEIDSAFLTRNNYESSKFMANFSRWHGARLVYASSAATYGAAAKMDDFTTDISTLRPLNPYAFFKNTFDQWMLAEGLLGKPRVHDDRIWQKGAVGLKFSNVFGFPEFHKESQQSLILQWYSARKAGELIPIFVNSNSPCRPGEQSRDFLSVKDAAKVAVWFGLDEQGRKAAGLFNVGAGQSHSFLRLAHLVVRNFDPTETLPDRFIEFVEMPENMRGRYQYFTELSIEKLRMAGYEKMMTPLSVAVKEYMEELKREEA